MFFTRSALGKHEYHLLLPQISAIITAMATKKTYRKTLCLIYIMTLFLWGICSGASSVSEITEAVCDAQNCYVNHSSAITSAARHLPAQKYLSARNTGARPLSRSVRQIASHLFSDIPIANLQARSGLLIVHEIPSHNPCGIKITNYIHLKDGQKS